MPHDGRERALLVGLAAVYVVLLQWTYVHDLHPRWAYMGLEHHAPAAWVRGTLSVLAVVPALWMPRALGRPSQIGLWFLYLLVYVPSLLVPMESVGGPPGRWIGLGVMLLGCMAGLCWSYVLPLGRRARMDAPEASPRFWLWFGVAAVGLHVAVVVKFGLPQSLPSWAEIYDVRAEFGDVARSGGRLGAYAVAWAANVINPVLIAWGVVRRRPGVVLLGVAGQLLLFGITALKSVVLSAGLIAVVVFVMRDGGRRFGRWMLGGATALLVLGMLEAHFADGQLVAGVLVRRTVVVPGQLMGLYVDYYAQHEHAWLGHSVLEGLVPHASAVAPPRLVGGQYFASVASANASVWADGYANFGGLGMAAATGLLAAVLWAYDRAAVGLPGALAAALFALPAFNLANSALLTSLLTHGVLLVIGVAALLPRVDRAGGQPA
ncbi:MAG: hypothetical protein K0V04_25900 [Deltaproteobacteria bacterium]|nr:hypothetical protein [Deltaproteobacteria bacterium]